MRLWSREGSACHRAMAQSVYPKEAALLFEEQGQSSRESPTGGTWGDGRARPGRPAEWPHLPLELLRFERGQGGIKQPPSPPLCEAHPGMPDWQLPPGHLPGCPLPGWAPEPAPTPGALYIGSHMWPSAKQLTSGPLLPGGRSSAPEPLGVSVWRMRSVVGTPSKS